MFYRSRTFKVICWVLVTTLFWSGFGPQVLHAATYGPPNAASGRAAHGRVKNPTPIEDLQFDALLTDLKTVIEEGGAQTRAAPDQGFAGIERLRELKAGLVEENEKVEEYFSQIEAFIPDKDLSPEIMARHQTSVDAYQTKYRTLMSHLKRVESAHQDTVGFWRWLPGRDQQTDWEIIIEEAGDFLEANTPQPKAPRFDPNNLPHRNFRVDEPIPPKLTTEEWQEAFPDLLPPPALPTPADLEETIEVQFTPDIIQLAADLNNNPVEIYNWVHNNVEFTPGWGSIQGAQLCLETRICNAFDTSSLLISLFRVSGIPARFQMGTIEVQIQEAMNWFGGFTDSQAATSMLATSGVPSTVVMSTAGEVESVRLEHVWVKAFTDFIPSSGSINRNGDTWIALDPSFKLYNYSQAGDLSPAVQLDLESLVQQAFADANITPDSIQNIDTQILQSASIQIRDQVHAYIEDNPDLAAIPIHGQKNIRPNTHHILPIGKPYRKLTNFSEMTNLPASIRHQIRFSILFSGTFQEDFHITLPLAYVASRPIFLNYIPASSEDQSIMESLIVDGELSDIIPALVQLRPALSVDDALIAMGSPITIGNAQSFRIEFLAPTITTAPIENDIVAGEQYAIVIDAQKVTYEKIVQEQQLLEQAHDLSDQEFAQEFADLNLGSHELYITALTWFYLEDHLGVALFQQQEMVVLRQPSAGMFALNLYTTRVFDNPISVQLSGMSMDIDHDVFFGFSRSGDAAKQELANLSVGFLTSLLEAKVPEILFSSESVELDWISAADIIMAANEQGVTIFNLNSANAISVLPQLHLDVTDRGMVEDLVDAGLTVTVPRHNVTIGDWQGIGIIAFDPQIGAATYLISGGANGAHLRQALADLQSGDYQGFVSNMVAAFGAIMGIIALFPRATFAAVKATINRFIDKLNDAWS